jgi:vitamin B12 transporter
VVNIITKTGSGPAKTTALAEAGSFGTFNQRAGISGASGRFNYVLGLAHNYSNGYDITPERLRPAGATPQRDGHDNHALSSKLGAEITDNFSVSWVSRVVRSASDFAAQPSDPNSRERTRQYFTRGEGHLALLDGRLTQTFGLGYTRYDRTSTDRPDELSPSAYDQHNLGTRTKADWQGNFALTNNQTITGGLETKLDANDYNSAFSSCFNETTNAHTRSNAAYLQLKSSFGDSFYNTIGTRIDDSDQFGAKTTYRIAPAYLVRSTGTKFKASLGTAYRAPTLFELYGADNFIGIGIFHGNPNLQPETSLGWDAGIEQTVLDSRVKFGTTYFSNKVDNYITYTADFTSLQNLASAKIHGVESFISFDVTKSVRLRADHTFTIAQDGATGGELRRRPKHKASAGVDYRPTDKATVSLTTLFVGPRVDADAVTFQNIRASSYTLVNLAGSYQLTDTWTAFGRIDNLFDRKYEDPQGFQRPGIGAFAGVRAVF